MPAKLRRADQRETPRQSARFDAIHRALDAVRDACDVPRRLAADPVGVVHRYPNAEDRELVALLASSLAFGNVKAMRAKIEDALDRLGPDVARVCDDPPRVSALLRGWKHRIYKDDDLRRLLVGARAVQRAEGSLGAALARDLAKNEDDLKAALGDFTDRIRKAGRLAKKGGAGQLLADPRKGSAAKRLHLLLRWMVRPDDGVDLGMWPVDPARLLIPVDTHIHRLGRNLGLTRRRDVSWKTAEEITAALRRFDPSDPVKFDFSLCHLGMLQHCPSRRDADRCEGCGVMGVCRHWSSGPA
jgi:uncharacterized protein (TIGR02757 family)